MIWQEIWKFLKTLWYKITNRKTSSKKNTTLDTASIKVFGLDMKVTREVSIDIPYELTVVVPRAELHQNLDSKKQEIILSSITISHSPRFKCETGEEEQPAPKTGAA